MLSVVAVVQVARCYKAITTQSCQADDGCWPIIIAAAAAAAL